MGDAVRRRSAALAPALATLWYLAGNCGSDGERGWVNFGF